MPEKQIIWLHSCPIVRKTRSILGLVKDLLGWIIRLWRMCLYQIYNQRFQTNARRRDKSS
jgi:hypothetical protein